MQQIFHGIHAHIFLNRIINVEMDTEKDRAKAFAGIECKADFIPAGSNIWMLPFLTKNWAYMVKYVKHNIFMQLCIACSYTDRFSYPLW